MERLHTHTDGPKSHLQITCRIENVERHYPRSNITEKKCIFLQYWQYWFSSFNQIYVFCLSVSHIYTLIRRSSAGSNLFVSIVSRLSNHMPTYSSLWAYSCHKILSYASFSLLYERIQETRRNQDFIASKVAYSFNQHSYSCYDFVIGCSKHYLRITP